MDPRLKAYQKQSRATPEARPRQEAPTVRTPELPRFEAVPEASVPESPPLVKTTVSGDRSLRKVAKFLILLGQNEAAKVVRHLDPAQIEALGREIAGIKKIEPVEAEAILKEFGYMASSQEVSGGESAAQAILDRAFGEERAQKILQKVVPATAERPFAFFTGLEIEVVSALLGSESPQVLSVVVPFLEKAQAAAFLKSLDPAQRLDLVKRLGKMEKVPSSVVSQVSQALQEKFHSLKPSSMETVDGKARLADILRHMSVDNEEAILKSLGQAKPELTEDLRRRLFTAADLIRVSDEGFEDLLRSRDDSQVALLWLAGDEPLRAKIETNISARRLLLVKAEADLLSDTPRRQLQKELRFFLDETRQAVREGRAALLDGSEDYV